MTKLELLTHPSIQSLSNKKEGLKIEFKPTASDISKTSLIHFLKDEIGANVVKIDELNFTFDKPLKVDKRKKIWFSVLKNAIFKMQNNINEIKTADEIETYFKDGEMAIGIDIDIDNITIKTNFDSSVNYAWVRIFEDGEIDIVGSLPEERINLEEILFMIDNINAFSDNKIIGLEAIIG